MAVIIGNAKKVEFENGGSFVLKEESIVKEGPKKEVEAQPEEVVDEFPEAEVQKPKKGGKKRKGAK